MTSSATFVPALLVIDMQYDFVHGSLAVPGAPSIIEVVNDLLTLPFAIKVATRDFHPANHISFASTHQKPVFSKTIIYPPGSDRKERPFEQVLWPDHCLASTPGSEFVQGLNHAALDAVVYKGTNIGIECYSAFRDVWHISNTELPKLLETCGVTDIFLVGLAGDFCVKYSAVDAIEFGYKTWVIRDAVRSVSDSGEEWGEMEKKGIREVDSTAVREKLRGQGLALSS